MGSTFKTMEAYREEAFQLYKNSNNAMFDCVRIEGLSREYGIFSKWLPEVLSAASEIAENQKLCIFCYFLYLIIKDEEYYNEHFTEIEFPDKGTYLGDFAPLFSLFYYAEDMIKHMTERRLPRKIICDTLREFDDKITDFNNSHNRPGIIDRIDWLRLFVYEKVIRISRFNIQFDTFAEDICVHGQDGTVYRLDVGASVLSIHIPSGLPLDKDYCIQSLLEAERIINRYYPELNPKAFRCVSWMMNPYIEQIMGKKSNLTEFSDMFLKYRINGRGLDIYTFVFNCSADIPLSDLPEDTSLQRSFKKHLLNGGKIYEFGGIKPFEGDLKSYN